MPMPRNSSELNAAYIADAMLGRLARWLRMLGFDVLYQAHIADQDLIRTAQRQGRVILTRDTEVALRRSVRPMSILITANDIAGQIREFLEKADIREGARNAPRCAACNGIQRVISDKESVAGMVPDHVYRQHDRFLRCEKCGKLYWEGSHFRNFQALLREIRASRR